MWWLARAACRPARPPVRWRGVSSIIGPPSRRPPSPVACVVPGRGRRCRRSGHRTAGPAASPPIRCGIAAVLWGMPWPRRSAPGTAARRPSRSSRPSGRRPRSRAAPRRDSSAISAPVPAALPGRLDVGEVAVGDEAEDHRVERVDLAAERAGQPDLVDRLDPGVIHQQPDAGVEGGLRQLDRPDVVLGHDDPRPAVAEPSWRR